MCLHAGFALFLCAGLCYKGAMPAALLYIHALDPVIFHLEGTGLPLALRWYGLAYVAGFALGYWVLLLLSRRRLYCVPPEKLGDFITLVCLVGVICGGRLGEFFFYWLPEQGLSGFLQDPLWVFRVWEGGMASHGGIIAVLLTACWWARRHGYSAAQIVDGLAIVSPIGLFFGRVANFINGELWGKITDSWCSVKFPTELRSSPGELLYRAHSAAEQAAGVQVSTYMQSGQDYWDALMQLCREHPAALQALAEYLPARYPSQLFEALGEGLLIFVILLTLRLTWRKAPAGIFSALFAFLYAAARIVCECFKEPDAGVWCGITQGQWLSLLIVLIGLVFLIIARKNARKAA